MRVNLQIVSALICGLLATGCSRAHLAQSVTLSTNLERIESRLVANDRFQAAVQARKQALAKEYGIEFDKRWTPVFRFEIPEHVNELVRGLPFCAHYNMVTEQFSINPMYQAAIESWPPILNSCFAETSKVDQSLLGIELKHIITHELGHALADQLSRRLGYGRFPSWQWYHGILRSAQIGSDMLCEGVARYFERADDSIIVLTELVIPEDIDDAAWQDKRSQISAIYEGGHWLVYPIIKKFGMRAALEYFYGNPFLPFDGRIRARAIDYQARALKTLDLPKPRHISSNR